MSLHQKYNTALADAMFGKMTEIASYGICIYILCRDENHPKGSRAIGRALNGKFKVVVWQLCFCSRSRVNGLDYQVTLTHDSYLSISREIYPDVRAVLPIRASDEVRN